MEAAMEQQEWSKLYYDSVEHLLWNPDWISGLQADGNKKSIGKVMERLRTLEAPLHHTVEMFITLAPHDFIARVLDIDPAESPHLRVLRCRDWEAVKTADAKPRSLLRLCQPDLLVTGRGVQVAVEIKAGSKSNLEQVLKYAALLLLRAPKPETGSRRKLLFLAPYQTFDAYWKRKAYADPDSLKEALRKVDDPKLDRKFRQFGTSLDEVKASLDGLEIDCRSLRDVQREIGIEQKRLAAEPHSAAGEVYAKLLSGFDTELRRWQQGA